MKYALITLVLLLSINAMGQPQPILDKVFKSTFKMGKKKDSIYGMWTGYFGTPTFIGYDSVPHKVSGYNSVAFGYKESLMYEYKNNNRAFGYSKEPLQSIQCSEGTYLGVREGGNTVKPPDFIGTNEGNYLPKSKKP